MTPNILNYKSSKDILIFRDKVQCGYNTIFNRNCIFVVKYWIWEFGDYNLTFGRNVT